MLIFLFLILFITGFAFNAFLLHLTTKFLKVEGSNYKTALTITILQWTITIVISIVTGIILAIIGFGYLNTILTLILGFVIFHKLFQKYYKTNLKKNSLIYIIFTVIIVIVSLTIIVPTRIYVIEPFYAKGAAMNPTYQNGDYLIIDKISKSYERGDVIVFRYPRDPQQFFIKRIVGLPGEKIQIKDTSVFLYNSKNPDGKILNEDYIESDIKTYGINDEILELSNNEYYVLGDNRRASKDSRVFGAVASSFIRGKVWFKAGENDSFK